MFERKKKPGTQKEAADQALIEDLYNRLNRAPYDQALYEKYKVKRYEMMNLKNEPVVVLRYDDKSIQDPRLEELATRRISSLIEAAKQITRGTPGLEAALVEIEGQAQSRLNELLKTSFQEKSFDAQQKEINHLIHQVLDNIAYQWSQTQPANKKPGDKDYKTFFEELAKVAEEINPLHKSKNFLSLNLDPKFNTFEYIGRGTHSRQGQFVPNARENISAHNRNQAGIANFSETITGRVEPLTGPVFSDTPYFRGGCLVPIGLFNKEGSELERMSITAQNVDLLRQEIQYRLSGGEEEKNPGKMTLVVMGLLTSIKKENQNLIISESNEAADLARAANPQLELINFNFGVNKVALGFGVSAVLEEMVGVKNYPKDQRFDNNRSFVRLYNRVLETLEAALPKPEAGKSASKEYQLLKAFREILGRGKEAFQKTDEVLLALSQTYHQALVTYQANKSSDNLTAVNKARTILQNGKTQAYSDMNAVIDNLKKAYDKAAPTLNKLIEELSKETKTINRPLTTQTLMDLATINQLFLNEGFREDKNNYQLQAHIVTIADNLGRIEASHNKDKELRRLFAAYIHCKSGNDRSNILQKILNLIIWDRTIPLLADMIFVREGDNKDLKARKTNTAESLSVNNANDEIAPQDTYGASKVQTSAIAEVTGHPAMTYAALLNKTSKWATKQLFKSFLKQFEQGYVGRLTGKAAYNPEANLFDNFANNLAKSKEALEVHIAKVEKKLPSTTTSHSFLDDDENALSLKDFYKQKKDPNQEKVDILRDALKLIKEYQQGTLDLETLQKQVGKLQEREAQRERTGTLATYGKADKVEKEIFLDEYEDFGGFTSNKKAAKQNSATALVGSLSTTLFAGGARLLDSKLSRHPTSDLINNLAKIIEDKIKFDHRPGKARKASLTEDIVSPKSQGSQQLK